MVAVIEAVETTAEMILEVEEPEEETVEDVEMNVLNNKMITCVLTTIIRSSTFQMTSNTKPRKELQEQTRNRIKRSRVTSSLMKKTSQISCEIELRNSYMMRNR